ncbi:MAG: zinc ribbon domain-containing protein, partial [Planctomycetota bacterium]
MENGRTYISCPKCGKENPDDAQLCNSCDSKLSEASQATKSVNVRVSKIAIISLICSLCGLVLTVSGVIVIIYPRTLSLRSDIIAVTVLLSLLTLGVALILGFISIIRIELSGGRVTGSNFAIGAVLISVFVGILPVWMLFFRVTRSVAFRMVCGTNLSGIGKAMLIYSNDYDDELPRAGGKSSTWAAKIPNWKASNRLDAYNLNKDGSGGQASISSSFYLLVKYG